MTASFIDYLRNTANRLPDKIAFEDAKESFSFSQLYSCVGTLGMAIRNRLGKDSKPVFVLVERSAISIVGMLAVTYSGNYYVPVDADLPDDRIEQMIEVAEPQLIVNCSERTVDYRIPTIDARTGINLEVETEEVLIDTNNTFYGIFTSGSTGKPKLVLKSHRALVSFAEVFTELFDFNEKDVLGNQIPFYFDASTKDIIATLVTGATTFIIDKQLFAQPPKLADCMLEKEMTTLVWVPSALSMLSMMGVLKKYKFPNIRRVMFVGEPMQRRQLNIWMQEQPDIEYVNLYGSTEGAGNCLYNIITEIEPDENRIALGKPFPKTKVMLLDEDRLIPTSEVDEVGEICVCGDCLAIGYYNNQEYTEERFVANPINTDGYERMYRSGDLGKYDENGNIVFVGRKDLQIKHSGYRIELGDIEEAANRIPEVMSSCCIYDYDKQCIVLYYASQHEDKNLVASTLREMLPKYMVPKKYLWLEEMPLNANGKIHRTLIKEMYKGVVSFG